MRRHQPILWILLGAALGGLTVFRFSPPPAAPLVQLDARQPLRAERNSEVGDHEPPPGELHAHDHADVDQQQIFAFQHEHEDSDVNKLLRQNVRILCWVMSGPNNTGKAKAVHNTWGSRCDKHVFITASKESGLPSVDLNITAGRDHLWEKTKRAFKHLYETEKDFDWFLKADDDTFVVVENLRFMLLAYSPQDPVYFGCKFKPFVKQGYMSGGSGYVLSREALRRFVEDALPDSQKCKQAESGAEDAELGKCLANVGVVAGDSRDKDGKHRMLPFPPTAHFDVPANNKSALPPWFHAYIFYSYKAEDEPSSDYIISFHYVNRANMYALYNMLYHARVFGLTDDSDLLAKTKQKDGEDLLDSLKRMAADSARPFAEMLAERERDLAPKKEGE